MSVTVPSTRGAPPFADVAPGRPIKKSTWEGHLQRLNLGYAQAGERIPLITQPVTSTSATYVRADELDGVVGVWRPRRVCDGDVYLLEVLMFAADVDVRLNVRDVTGSSALTPVTESFTGVHAWRTIALSVAAADAFVGSVANHLALDLEIKRNTTEASILQAFARATRLTGAQLP